MAIRTLSRAEWDDYFDAFSSTLTDTARIAFAIVALVIRPMASGGGLPRLAALV